MTSRTPFLILAVALVVGTGCQRSLESTQPSAAEAGDSLATYHSERYGFTFTHPASFDLNEYTPEIVAVGQSAGDTFESVAEIYLERSSEASPATYEGFVLERARVSCAADGPTSSLQCTDVRNRRPFVTEAGVKGEVFYLLQETIDISTGTVADTSSRGPFYAFYASADTMAEVHSVLLVRPPAAVPPSTVDTALVRRIASSVSL